MTPGLPILRLGVLYGCLYKQYSCLKKKFLRESLRERKHPFLPARKPGGHFTRPTTRPLRLHHAFTTLHRPRLRDSRHPVDKVPQIADKKKPAAAGL